MVFVRYRPTEDYVEKFSFAVHLPNILQEKKCLGKKIPSLSNVSFRELTACLFVLMVVRS